jgi:hypothetical protein
MDSDYSSGFSRLADVANYQELSSLHNAADGYYHMLWMADNPIYNILYNVPDSLRSKSC